MSREEGGLRSEVARVRKIAADLALYREISQRLLAASSTNEIVIAAAAAMTELFGAQGAGILMAATASESEVIEIDRGSPAELWEKIPEGARRGVLRATQREQRALAETDPRAFFAREGLPNAPALNNFIALPMRLEPNRVGALIGLNMPFPARFDRYLEDAAALVSPIRHAIVHVRLLESRVRHAHLLEAFIENAQGQMAYLDRDFRFIQANSAYVEGCGHTREELIGRNHFDLFPDAENEAIFARARETGEAVEFHEKPFVYVDQPERGVTYWNWRLVPIKGEEGSVEGLVFTLTDMTEFVRTREQLVAAESARADVAEILATEVDHRMKNNLAMVAGLLQMELAGRQIDDQAAALVGEAMARIQTIAEVHSQLYASKGESIDILGALRQIAEIARGALPRGNVEISVQGAPFVCHGGMATSFCVSANELLTNAIKHGAPGPDGVLRVKVDVAREKGKLTLSVWNSGNPVAKGLDPEKQATMGLRLIQEIATRQYQGSFTLVAQEGGTLATVVVDEKRLMGKVGLTAPPGG